jgi:Fe2+ transport system protein FeoA
MTMDMLDEGSEFVIGRVHLLRETGKRLADMGFTEGAHGLIVRRGFFFGPLQINLGESDVMIRVEEAEGIDVEPVGNYKLYMLNRKRHGHGPGRGSGKWPGHGTGRGWGRHDA